jgi:hypothetical protein
MARNGWHQSNALFRHYKDGLLHCEDGPAVKCNDNFLWYIDGKICLTIQQWANTLVEKKYKTNEEAIMLVLKWSKG